MNGEKKIVRINREEDDIIKTLLDLKKSQRPFSLEHYIHVCDKEAAVANLPMPPVEDLISGEWSTRYPTDGDWGSLRLEDHPDFDTANDSLFGGFRRRF